MSMGPRYERDELYADGVAVVEPAGATVVDPTVAQPLVAPATIAPGAAAPVMQPMVQQPLVQQPLVPQPLVRPMVAQPVVEAAPLAPAAAVRQSTVWRFDAASVLTVVFGIALLIFGLIALVRAGTDGDWTTPVVDVAGFGHTAILGAIEIGAGLVLLIAGFAGSRSASMFFATIIGVGAFVAGAQTSSFDELGIESSFAWLLAVSALIVVLAQAVLPTVVGRRSAVYSR